MIVPIFLLPILTRFLGPADYGIIATFRVLLTILVLLIELNMTGAVGVNFFHLEREDFEIYMSNVFWVIGINTLIVFVGTLFLRNKLAALIKFPSNWLIFALVFAFFQVLSRILLTVWRVEQKASFYTAFQVSQTLLNIAFSLIFVVWLKLGWEGRVLGIGITAIISGIFAFFVIVLPYLRLKINSNYIKDALIFGIPLIPHSLSGWITTATDRLFINAMVNLSATGLYSVGYQIGAVIRMVAMSFNKAWSPFLFEKLKNIDGKTKLKIVKFTYAAFLGYVLLAILLSLVSLPILKIFVTKRFWAANRYVIWISMAYAAQGMYFLVVGYIFFLKKTYILTWITLLSALVNVPLNYFFIKWHGSIGAAEATTVTFFLKFLMAWGLSALLYPMPWFLGKLNKKRVF